MLLLHHYQQQFGRISLCLEQNGKFKCRRKSAALNGAMPLNLMITQQPNNSFHAVATGLTVSRAFRSLVRFPAPASSYRPLHGIPPKPLVTSFPALASGYVNARLLLVKIATHEGTSRRDWSQGPVAGTGPL